MPGSSLSARSVPLVDQQRRDEEARQREEDRHSEVAPVEEADVEVEDHNERHRDAANAVESGLVGQTVRRDRPRSLINLRPRRHRILEPVHRRSTVLVVVAGYARAVPAEDLDDVAGASMTPLERQQLDLVDPTAHTFWHWVRFDIVVAAAHAAGRDHDRRHRSRFGNARRPPPQRSTRTSTYRFDELSPALDRQLEHHFGAAARFGVRRADHLRLRRCDARRDRTHRRRRRQRWQRGVSEWTRAPGSSSRCRHCSGRSPRGTPNSVTSGGTRDHGCARCSNRPGFAVRRCDYLFPEMLPLVAKRKLRPSADNVDMPRLSDRVNRIGYAVSSTTGRMRRIWPAGTSVVAIAEVTR